MRILLFPVFPQKNLGVPKRATKKPQFSFFFTIKTIFFCGEVLATKIGYKSNYKILYAPQI